MSITAALTIILLRSRERAISVSLGLVLSHIHAVADGRTDAAMADYSPVFLTGLRGGPSGWRSTLASIRGLRRCEELEAHAAFDWCTGSPAWRVGLRFHTGYSNDPPQLMYREDFIVRVCVTSTRPEITHHGFD